MLFPDMTLLSPLWALNLAHVRKSDQKAALGKKRTGRFKAAQLATLDQII